jgi:SAM-dependent methyltransferase
MEPRNSYEDARRAAAYAELEFPGTYYLAFRDLPRLLREHATGNRAVDFGCGAGRSTRFLRELGYAAIGVDISADMLAEARVRDPGGDYRLTAEGGLQRLAAGETDLVMSAFTFDNVPGPERKMRLLRDIARLLAPRGLFLNLVSSPEIYVHEWASFSTKDYPENRRARSGDRVRIVITDIADGRPVEDVVCSDDDYRALYARAGLEPVATHRPLGLPEEPQPWVSETRIPPWTIYLLRRGAPGAARAG